ncbi:MAG TPA: cysteine desulfurase NifS [Candidatus Edwardsbacteria bacterium]|nr:cysteine desulfurase NifS [Candidatus Edwardsbacteria bacterium]
MERIYLDHNATTPVRPEVLEAMLPYLTSQFGNASSIHSFGREARTAVEQARLKLAAALGCEPAEVVFTGSGTEADNMALVGAAFALRERGNHIVTTRIEHHAVLHTVEYLVKYHGCQASYVGVDRQGLVDPDAVARAITDRTILVSVMHANNETGAVQPLEQIGRICRDKGVPLHSDAVQTFGKLPTDVGALGLSLLSLSGHKIYAPKGVGALYVKKGTRLHPLVHGGAHERNRRAGTENVAGIVALAAAAELAARERDGENGRIGALRDRLWEGIRAAVPGVHRNGHAGQCLAGTLNVSFDYIEGESILLSLDLKGIAASSGSACTSGSLEPSHVLLAMGMPVEQAHGSVRFSLGHGTTAEQIDRTVTALTEAVARLREMSPLAPPACGPDGKDAS